MNGCCNGSYYNEPAEKEKKLERFQSLMRCLDEITEMTDQECEENDSKNKWLIHDYFFGKTLDKVRPGGIIAFITSKGTMDKANPAVRKYIAQRADLIGAIRLPSDTFTKNAGTKVTSDILFLQKRERITDIEPDWVYLDKDENGIEMNSYFVSHPEMIMGSMQMVSSRYGSAT